MAAMEIMGFTPDAVGKQDPSCAVPAAPGSRRRPPRSKGPTHAGASHLMEREVRGLIGPVSDCVGAGHQVVGVPLPGTHRTGRMVDENTSIAPAAASNSAAVASFSDMSLVEGGDPYFQRGLPSRRTETLP